MLMTNLGTKQRKVNKVTVWDVLALHDVAKFKNEEKEKTDKVLQEKEYLRNFLNL
jgi:hypothetical protein